MRPIGIEKDTENILPPCDRSKHFKFRKNIIPESTPILCLPLNNIFPTNYDYVKLTFGVYSLYNQIEIYVHTTKNIFGSL